MTLGETEKDGIYKLGKNNPISWEPVCFRLCCSHMGGGTFTLAPGDSMDDAPLGEALVVRYSVNSLRLQLKLLKARHLILQRCSAEFPLSLSSHLHKTLQRSAPSAHVSHFITFF